MRSIVYHQFREELHIIKTLVLYIIIEKGFYAHLRCDEMRRTRAAMIYTTTSWWYTIAFAMDKKISKSEDLEFFVIRVRKRTGWKPRIFISITNLVLKETKEHLPFVSSSAQNVLFYIIEKINGIVIQESKWETTVMPAAIVVSLPSALGITIVLSPRGIAREHSAQI